MANKCENGCDSKAEGVVPVHDKKGGWMGNKRLCSKCIAKLPTAVKR